ncbi:hypothetical protein BS47DRAFT_1365288 [Hydnum rufescens UP504]|uniref:Uncharacterized protein n=1 Tax=Hydnum rufescens UP504 TaxID=1448309 RepID=A0A9P6AP76_9AGAM|nr:hypothetical protein BS47DRAFT_1365288 [Hydnum rufescens UP504]
MSEDEFLTLLTSPGVENLPGTIPLSVVANALCGEEEISGASGTQNTLVKWFVTRGGGDTAVHLDAELQYMADSKFGDVNEPITVNFIALLLYSAASPCGNLHFNKVGPPPPGLSPNAKTYTLAGFQPKITFALHGAPLWPDLAAIERSFRRMPHFATTVAANGVAAGSGNPNGSLITKSWNNATTDTPAQAFNLSHDLFMTKCDAAKYEQGALAASLPTHPTVLAATAATILSSAPYQVHPYRPTILTETESGSLETITFDGNDLLLRGDVIRCTGCVTASVGPPGVEIVIIPEDIVRIGHVDLTPITVYVSPKPSPMKWKHLGTDSDDYVSISHTAPRTRTSHPTSSHASTSTTRSITLNQGHHNMPINDETMATSNDSPTYVTPSTYKSQGRELRKCCHLSTCNFVPSLYLTTQSELS